MGGNKRAENDKGIDVSTYSSVKLKTDQVEDRPPDAPWIDVRASADNALRLPSNRGSISEDLKASINAASKASNDQGMTP